MNKSAMHTSLLLLSLSLSLLLLLDLLPASLSAVEPPLLSHASCRKPPLVAEPASLIRSMGGKQPSDGLSCAKAGLLLVPGVENGVRPSWSTAWTTVSITARVGVHNADAITHDGAPRVTSDDG
jgi:hypothetical protein